MRSYRGKMRWEIQHRTRYRYASPVKDSVNQIRLHPANSDSQTIEKFQLTVQPSAHIHRFKDFHGNTVEQFEIADSHETLLIESCIHAQTEAQRMLNLSSQTCPMANLQAVASTVQCFEFLGASTFVSCDPAIASLAATAAAGVDDVWQSAIAVAQFVHRHIEYVAHATSVHTHMRDVLERRRGVCQDYAHVALGLCRALKIPAAYVSGYMAAQAANATHAWIEVFVPNAGWQGIDPTHDRLIDERYLKIALGRDYEDVAPIKGRYRGTLQHTMDVQVQIANSP